MLGGLLRISELHEALLFYKSLPGHFWTFVRIPLGSNGLRCPMQKALRDLDCCKGVSARPESRLMYLVFDLLCLNEEDIKGAPLVGRRGILRRLFPNGYDL